MNLAFLVENTLLKRIFATNISAVGVATSLGYLILSPPTMKRVLSLSYFSLRTLHTKEQ